ncbi:MAG TPA: hypothetical protein VFX49_17965 [Chloroflexota bacterium]|nr:hypothetical protein [Chloroflexota bacterium]
MAITFPTELREAYALREGLPPDEPLSDDDEEAFLTWARGYTLRRLAMRLTRTGEWTCLVDDVGQCRLQRAHLPVPRGWRVAWRFGA